MDSYGKLTEKKRPVLIWGGAMYGEIAYVVLTQLYGKNVEAVIDNKLREVSWADIKVIRTGELEKYSGVDILVCAANAFGHIVRGQRSIRTEIYDCLTAGKFLRIINQQESRKSFKQKAYMCMAVSIWTR